jgi:hypothetical protein
MRSFPPAEFERRQDASDLYASTHRDWPATFAKSTRLVALVAIALGFMVAAELLVGMPR